MTEQRRSRDHAVGPLVSWNADTVHLGGIFESGWCAPRAASPRVTQLQLRGENTRAPPRVRHSSAVSPPSLASRAFDSLRSIFARGSSSSCLVAARASTRRSLRNLSQLKRASYHEELGLVEHLANEVVPSPCPRAELLGRPARRVHGPGKTMRSSARDRSQVAERDFADDQQVHVARAHLGPARQRTEDQRDPDSLAEGLEKLAEDVHEPGRLDHEPLELGEDGAFRVGLVVDLDTFLPPREHAGLRERCELGLHGRGLEAQVAGELADVPAALWMEEQRPEDRLPGSGHQSVEQPICSHISYKHTKKAYKPGIVSGSGSAPSPGLIASLRYSAP